MNINKKLSKGDFLNFNNVLFFPVYYYNDMLTADPNLRVSEFFDRADAEHFSNHIHLGDFFEVNEYSIEDFRNVAKLLFYRLRCEFPNVPVIVYLIMDEDGKPIIDFASYRAGEDLYYDISINSIEYYCTEPICSTVKAD